MVDLDAETRDSLTEIFNIGVGQAANALSELVQDEVLLTVPQVGLLKRADFIAMAAQRWDGRASIVRQSFDGPFHGDALLIFPEAGSLELVRVLLAESAPLEEMTDLEREALLEVGNVVLNACLSCIADVLEHEIANALPTYLEAEPAKLVSSIVPGDDWSVIYLHIDFTVHSHNLSGTIIFVLDVPAADAFTAAVARVVQRYQVDS